MKRLLLIALLASPAFAQDKWDSSASEAQLMDRASRAYGTHFAQQLLQKQGLTLDVDKFMESFRAIAEGKPPLISEEDRTSTFAEMRDFLENRPKWQGSRFLAENQTKEGIKTTSSGLQYQVLKEADGAKPAASSTVTVHYTGKLIDGTVFDSSVERGEPASFGLSQVIAGWTEGLQLMPKGSKFRFFIPYNLAYGEAGSPPKIPGYSALIFDVELLKIEP